MSPSASRTPLLSLLASALAALVLVATCAEAAHAGARSGGHHRSHHKKRSKPPVRYWGAWIGSQYSAQQPPWDMSGVSTLEATVHKPLSLIEFSAPFADCARSPCSYSDFPAAQMDNVRNYGAIPFFSWGSQTTPWNLSDAAANGPNIRLAEIANGGYDNYIRRFASEAAAWGKPFFLRFNWEMNGGWFPWGVGISGNVPSDFVPAWRHVHDLFAAAGASNVTWVWCPYTDSGRRFLNYRPFYPGNSYVDWTCLDAYNWGTNVTNPVPWHNFDQLLARGYAKMAKLAPKKPMILGEIGSSADGGNKARWIRRMMRSLRRGYSKVRGLIWFDQVDRKIDWRLASSASVASAFAAGIAGPRYTSNAYGGLETTPIPPPR